MKRGDKRQDATGQVHASRRWPKGEGVEVFCSALRLGRLPMRNEVGQTNRIDSSLSKAGLVRTGSRKEPLANWGGNRSLSSGGPGLSGDGGAKKCSQRKWIIGLLQ